MRNGSFAFVLYGISVLGLSISLPSALGAEAVKKLSRKEKAAAAQKAFDTKLAQLKQDSQSVLPAHYFEILEGYNECILMSKNETSSLFRDELEKTYYASDRSEHGATITRWIYRMKIFGPSELKAELETQQSSISKLTDDLIAREREQAKAKKPGLQSFDRISYDRNEKLADLKAKVALIEATMDRVGPLNTDDPQCVQKVRTRFAQTSVASVAKTEGPEECPPEDISLQELMAMEIPIVKVDSQAKGEATQLPPEAPMVTVKKKKGFFLFNWIKQCFAKKKRSPAEDTVTRVKPATPSAEDRKTRFTSKEMPKGATQLLFSQPAR